MIKGFHIPFYWKADQIIELGETLIASGIYRWIEIKWAEGNIGVQSDSYVQGIRHLVRTYPELQTSCHIPTNLDLGQTNTGMQRELIRQIKKCIDYAAEFRVSILPLHPGTIMTMDIPVSGDTELKRRIIEAGEKKKEAAQRLTVAVTQEIAEYASQYKMTIALENLLLPQEIAHTAEALKEIVDLCAMDNVKALYDCGHAHRVGADTAEFVRVLGDRLCHVHLNDNDGTCDLHMQLETGNIPFQPIFDSLREIQYQGALVMETMYRNSDDLLQSAVILDQYLQN